MSSTHLYSETDQDHAVLSAVPKVVSKGKLIEGLVRGSRHVFHSTIWDDGPQLTFAMAFWPPRISRSRWRTKGLQPWDVWQSPALALAECRSDRELMANSKELGNLCAIVQFNAI